MSRCHHHTWTPLFQPPTAAPDDSRWITWGWMCMIRNVGDYYVCSGCGKVGSAPRRGGEIVAHRCQEYGERLKEQAAVWNAGGVVVWA